MKGMKKVFQWLLILVVLYALLLYYLYAFQDTYIFFPPGMDEARWEQVAEELHGDFVTMKVSDQMKHSVSGEEERIAVHLQGWFFPGRKELNKPTIIYFGGNAERLDLLAYHLDSLRDEGINLLLLDYRGYGLSEGKPSANTMRADAEIVFDAAAKYPYADSGSIIAWGTSLGTGVATHLASERPVEKVILISPYTSTTAIAKDLYWYLPVELLFKHKMNNLILAPSLKQPALIIAGSDDRTIPPDHAQAVADAWGGEAQLMIREGKAHNELLDTEMLKTIADFILE
jgi:hypothetical protein